MKKLYPVLAICLALALTACSKDTPSNVSSDTGSDGSSPVSSDVSSDESSVSTSTTSTSSSTVTTSTTSSNGTGTSEPAEVAEFLVGLAGDTIKAEDYLEEYLERMRGVTPENFEFCETNCTYAALPEGIFRTNLSNPDVFDKENNCFTDVPLTKKKGFVRVKAGDEINGFKVKKAKSYFTSMYMDKPYQLADGTMKKGSELGFPEIYFRHGELELEGTVEMTGYISIVAEDEYGKGVGDILFVPTECKPALPIVLYKFDPNEGFYHDVGNAYMEGDLVYTNEYGCSWFVLGNKDEVTADISMIPKDGSWVKAKVVAENFTMSSSIEWFTKVNSTLVSVE